MGIAIWTLIIVIIVFIMLLIFEEVQNRRKQSEISELKMKLEKFQETAKPDNQRNFFRTEISDESCRMELMEFGDPSLERLKNKKIVGRVQDLSISGLRFVCEFDLPVRKDIHVQVEFELQDDEPYSIKGTLLRKEEFLKNQKVIYGVKFVNIDSETEKRLHAKLNLIELERRKRTI